MIIDTEKYRKQIKYRDFDLFQFKGIKKISEQSDSPYVKIVKSDDSLFLLICPFENNCFEKKFVRSGSCFFERETKIETGDTLNFIRYFTKDYFLEYLIIPYRSDGKPIQVHAKVKKVTKHNSQLFYLDGDSTLLNLWQNLDFNNLPNEHISYKFTTNVQVTTDSSFIKFMRTVSDSLLVTSIYKTEYEGLIFGKYSIFWDDYLDYKIEKKQYPPIYAE